MHWQNKCRILWRQHARRTMLLAGVAVVFLALYVIIAKFATPHQPRQVVASEFYSPQKAAQSNLVRVSVVSVRPGEATVRVIDGLDWGKTLSVKVLSIKPQPGDQLLVSITPKGQLSEYAYSFWRVPGLVGLTLLFVLLVLIVSGKRGVASLAGLFISIGVIAAGLIPAIIQGANAFWACIVAAFIIATTSIIVAHGWRWRSFVSLLSIYMVLLCAIILACIGGAFGYLTGVYDETSAILQVNNTALDMRGVLLGGIIIATLGVLDDVITAQTATVDELHRAQPKLSLLQLIRHAYSVGTEHVIAVVNTLALAYVGASLPIILSISASFDSYSSPFLIFNSEFIAQEVVRTLVSSMALVLAVPISTVIAALLITRKAQLFAIIKRKINARRK